MISLVHRAIFLINLAPFKLEGGLTQPKLHVFIRLVTLLSIELVQGIIIFNGMFLTWKNSNHQCRYLEPSPGRLPDRRTLYLVAIKAVLCHKAVQVYHIPILHIPPPVLDSRRPRISILATTQYQATKSIGPPSLSDGVIYVALGVRCIRWKKSSPMPRPGIEPGPPCDRRTL